MKLHHSLSLAAVAAALALASGAALAESQYGYASSGTGTVTATARVNLSVTVPKLILLRVGSANTTLDTLSWTAALTIPAVPTTPANGNDQFVNWDGAAPGAGSVTNPGAVSVWAWTNSSGGGSLNYAATAFAANGPVLGDIAVASGAGLAHPGTALAASGTAVTFARNAVQTGSWTDSLGGTPASWVAGAYMSTVTDTATSI